MSLKERPAAEEEEDDEGDGSFHCFRLRIIVNVSLNPPGPSSIEEGAEEE